MILPLLFCHPSGQGRDARGATASKLVQSKSGYKLPFPIPEMQSAFRLLAQRDAFRGRDGRQQSRFFALRNPSEEIAPSGGHN